MGNRIDTQERLIAATRHIIIEEGMEATSLEHICKTAGFTRGAFYSNFASKDSLLAALAEDEYTGLIERLRLTIDHWASSSSFVEEDGVEASGELLIENLLFEALDAIGTNRELHLLHTELLLRSIRDPEWAERFLDINLEFVDELGRSLEWILQAAGRELTHPLRALTHSVIGVVMRASGVAAWRESMRTLRLQERTTKFASSPADSIPASSLHNAQASAQNVELSQGLRSEGEDSSRTSGAREILETVLHPSTPPLVPGRSGEYQHAGNTGLRLSRKPTKLTAPPGRRPHLHMPTRTVEPMTEAALRIDSGIDPLEQVSLYPRLRYMGSKYRLLPALADVFTQLNASTAIDPFSGSGVVSYLLKSLGYSVTSSDYLHFPVTLTSAACVNQNDTLSDQEITMISSGVNRDQRDFISRTYEGRFFTSEDLHFLDSAWSHIDCLPSTKKDLAISALVLAAARKQPRGIFTVTGLRYDDGRPQLHTPLREQFITCAHDWNRAVFSARPCRSFQSDALGAAGHADVVYLDPPYARYLVGGCR